MLEVLAKLGVRLFGFGYSFEESVLLAKAGQLGGIPFAVSGRGRVFEKGGRSGDRKEPDDDSGVIDEFDRLKDAILFHYLKDIRRMGANIFVDWWKEEN